jgi:nicotinate-nucleotide pyrophosphorylase (carboxylating)
MRHPSNTFNQYRLFIEDALRKDLGPRGDVTSRAVIPPHVCIQAECIVKEKRGIISGLHIMQEVFRIIDPAIVFIAKVRDGDSVKRGRVIATVAGSAQGIFAGERVGLELVRHMSGIATKTRAFVEKVKGTGVIILDTRKILPGYLEFDKKAVRDGGADNHRLTLSDMGLIKSNHIDVLQGDIRAAVRIFRQRYPDIPLEIEVRNQKEFADALSCSPQRILLDNMGIADIRRAVRKRNEYAARLGKKIPLEASGGITLVNILVVAKTGVEYISIGELTHSAKALDISLHFVYKKK